METLKEKLYQVLAGAMEVSAFEEWLYANTELIELIDKDSSIYDLYTLNFKSSDILESLANYATKTLGPAEVLMAKIEKGCRELKLTDNFDQAERIVIELSYLHDWDDVFELTTEFYFLEECFSTFRARMNQNSDCMAKAKLKAETILELSKEKSVKEKVDFLISGLSKKKVFQIKAKTPKPWYQFW